jgi:hypothetical protein
MTSMKNKQNKNKIPKQKTQDLGTPEYLTSIMLPLGFGYEVFPPQRLMC